MNHLNGLALSREAQWSQDEHALSREAGQTEEHVLSTGESQWLEEARSLPPLELDFDEIDEVCVSRDSQIAESCVARDSQIADAECLQRDRQGENGVTRDSQIIRKKGVVAQNGKGVFSVDEMISGIRSTEVVIDFIKSNAGYNALSPECQVALKYRFACYEQKINDCLNTLENDDQKHRLSVKYYLLKWLGKRLLEGESNKRIDFYLSLQFEDIDFLLRKGELRYISLSAVEYYGNLYRARALKVI